MQYGKGSNILASMKILRSKLNFRTPYLKSIRLLLLVGLAMVMPVHATPNAQDSATIEYLINYVSESDMVFERNFSKYKSDRAASHIRKKYDHFLDDIDSPEEFIELCASKSLMTGSEYNVTDPAGVTIKSRDWLLGELDNYRLNTGQVVNN